MFEGVDAVLEWLIDDVLLLNFIVLLDLDVLDDLTVLVVVLLKEAVSTE